MLRVEIADTPSSQARGLMYRKSMPYDAGMVFLFNKPKKLNFWGVNTYIPLDIAFVDDNNHIVKISRIDPHSYYMVSSEKRCNIAIEANMDFFNQNNIAVGDKINLSQTDPINAYITFEKQKTNKFAQEVEDFYPKPSPDLPIVTPEDIDQILEDTHDEGYMVPEVEEVPPVPEAPVPEAPVPNVPITEEEFPEFPTTYDAMQWADQNNESVRIWYKTKAGKDLEREIEPHGQFLAKSTGNQILVVFDKTVGEIRAFILNNIMYYVFSGEKFEPKFVLKA